MSNDCVSKTSKPALLISFFQIRPNALENDEDTDSACEDLDEEFQDDDVIPMIPQKVITLADEALSGLPPRYKLPTYLDFTHI